jgi:N-acetylmuramoyl-L-alanine amidase
LIFGALISVNLITKPSLSQAVSESDEGNALAEEDQQMVEPPPVEEPPAEPAKDPFIVVIDPGHGGEDPGAEGASGSYEKDFTLAVSLKVVQLLEDVPDVEAHMTRETDIFLSSETRDRPNFANKLDADLFISIHANTFADPTVTGTETFYYHDHSLGLANIIHRHVAKATGFRDRGVSQENFFVLRDTTMPAALLEIGYLTNPADEQVMLTEEFQQSVAEAIVDGIKEYLGL